MKKVIRTPDFPIVKTRQGRLHGFQQDDGTKEYVPIRILEPMTSVCRHLSLKR